MSLGSSEEDAAQTLKSVFEPYFKKATENGIILCAAAGNNSFNADYVFPGYMEDTIAVSNIQDDNTLNPSSARGTVVDIAAPGTDIISAYPDLYNEGKYFIAQMSGTSMACPHVSAAAAMLLTKDPSLSPTRIKDLLTSNAIDLGEEGKDIYFGYGALNMRGYFLERPQIAGISRSSDGSKVNISFEQDGEDLQNSALLIAAGFKNNRFVCWQSTSIISSDAKTLSDTAFADCDLIKAFAWDSFAGMNPVSRMISTEFTN